MYLCSVMHVYIIMFRMHGMCHLNWLHYNLQDKIGIVCAQCRPISTFNGLPAYRRKKFQVDLVRRNFPIPTWYVFIYETLYKLF